jgi:hypothetical protein
MHRGAGVVTDADACSGADCDADGIARAGADNAHTDADTGADCHARADINADARAILDGDGGRDAEHRVAVLQFPVGSTANHAYTNPGYAYTNPGSNPGCFQLRLYHLLN